MKGNKKLASLAAGLILAAIVLGIVAVFVLLGGGILKLFGFQYDSKGAFLGFSSAVSSNQRST